MCVCVCVQQFSLYIEPTARSRSFASHSDLRHFSSLLPPPPPPGLFFLGWVISGLHQAAGDKRLVARLVDRPSIAADADHGTHIDRSPAAAAYR